MLIVATLACLAVVHYVTECSGGMASAAPTEERREPDKFAFLSKPVTLRIMVLTFSRAASLRRLLTSLSNAEYDGFRIDLDIWIDKPATGRGHNPDVLMVSDNFDWPYGLKNVHPQPEHVGIIGQWIDTWQPTSKTTEMCVFLEDDLDVSPFYFRWLKAAHEAYAHRPDVSGFTLQKAQLRAKNNGKVSNCAIQPTSYLLTGPSASRVVKVCILLSNGWLVGLCSDRVKLDQVPGVVSQQSSRPQLPAARARASAEPVVRVVCEAGPSAHNVDHVAYPLHL